MRLEIRRGVAVVAVVGLLVACSGDGADDPTPIGGDVPEAPEETDDPPVTEPEPAPDDEDEAEVDIDTIPDDPAQIDDDYVQRVIDDVDVRLAEAFGAIRAHIDGELGAEETLERLGVVYEGPLAAERLSSFGDGSGAGAVEADPEAPQSRVREIQTADVDCLSVLVERDVTGMLSPPGDPRVWSLTLVPASSPDGLAWRLRHGFSGDEEGIDFDGCAEEVPS